MNEKQMTDRILKYLTDDYGDLVMKTFTNSPKFIFYTKNDKIIFDYNINNRYVFINADLFNFLQLFFNLTYELTKYVIEKWVTNTHNINFTHLIVDNIVSKIRWEYVK